LAKLDLGTGIEQRFDCLVVENRQAMRSIGSSMDWTLKNNMVNGLYFCATLTSSRRGQKQFV